MAGLGRRSHYRKHLTNSVLNGYPEPGDGERIAKVVGTRGSNQFEVVLSISRRKSSAQAQQQQEQSHQDLRQRHESQHQRRHEASKASPMIPSSARTPKLAILPTKYRKLVWVKRNDFVIVRCGEDEEEVDEDSITGNEAPSDGDTEVEEAGGGRSTAAAAAVAAAAITTKSSSSKQHADTKVSNTSTPVVISGIRYEIIHILYRDQVKHLKRKGLWPEDDPCFSEGVPDDSDAAAVANESRIKHNRDEAFTRKDDLESHDDEEDGNNDGIVYDADDAVLFVNTNKISTLRVEDSESESESDSSYVAT